MNNDILYRIFENKSKLKNRFIFNKSVGKLETSIDLVREMIYLLPEDLFISNDTKFLDPCAGTGTFILVILERLLKYKSYDIAIKQVYMSEINPSLVNGYLSNMIFLPKSKIKLEITSDWVNEYFNLFIDFISGKTKTFNDLSYIIYSESIKNELDNMILNITKFIEKYEKVSKLESKLFGEVFTPQNLVKEMLSFLPEDIWKDKNIKWLDPAVGIGNFPSVIVEKLMKGLEDEIPLDSERYKWIMEEMIYMCDISTKNLFLLYKLFDENNSLKLNVYRGSFLEDGFNKHMKDVWGLNGFDVVVGNPPYNDINGIKGGGNNLYVPFMDKSLNILNDDGVLSFVTNAGWMKKTDLSKPTILDKIMLLNLLHLNINECKKWFDVGGAMPFCYFIIKNNSNYENTFIVSVDDNDNRYESISDLKRLSWVPRIVTEEVYSLIDKFNNKKFKFKRIDSITDDQKKSNMIGFKRLSHLVKPYNVKATEELESGTYLTIESLNVKSDLIFFNSKIFSFLNFIHRYDAIIYHYMVNFFGYDGDLSNMGDDELYNYFNLNQEEIDLIEKTIKV